MYCSQTCKIARAVKERECKACGAPFRPNANQQYCGTPCKAPSVLAQSKRPPQEPRPCVRCGAEYQPINAHQKYCSPDCKSRKDQPPKWKLNPDFQYKDSTWSRYVIENCGKVCVDCGEAGREGKPLHAHHLIPKARGGKNVIRNGIALCPDCHRIRHDNSLAGDDLVERIALRVMDLMKEAA
jgi:hypothetical protein